LRDHPQKLDHIHLKLSTKANFIPLNLKQEKIIAIIFERFLRADTMQTVFCRIQLISWRLIFAESSSMWH
jgi:hypothetical protein